MDEKTLQDQISTYKLQLHQVQFSLRSRPTDSDLIQLQDNLKELIQLSEDALLSAVQKSQVLQIKNDCPPTSTSENNEMSDFDAEWALFQAEVVADPPAEKSPDSPCLTFDFKTIANELNSLINTRCQAPFSQEWGEFDYHNAIILNIDVDEDATSLEDVQVSVVFCNPKCTAMQPCPFFLEARCRFEATCRFSHGHKVRMTDLRPFKEPDYGSLQNGCQCLVKHTDGLWYKAKIEHIEEGFKFVVKFDHYFEAVSVNLEEIFPLVSKDEKELISSESSSEENEEEEEEEIMEAVDEEVFIPWVFPAGPGSCIGEWEAHTKGIGSKLLQRMGYVIGHGLGKNLDGRLEPVEAVVLPAGKSLDKIMELKDHNQLKNSTKLKKNFNKKKGIKKSKSDAGSQRPKTVFDFINNHLGGKQKKDTHLKEQAENLKNSSIKGLNVELLKVHEEMKNADKELNQLKIALSRNEGRDKKVATQISEKIASIQSNLGKLQQKERSVRSEQQMRTNKQKLTVF